MKTFVVLYWGQPVLVSTQRVYALDKFSELATAEFGAYMQQGDDEGRNAFPSSAKGGDTAHVTLCTVDDQTFADALKQARAQRKGKK